MKKLFSYIMCICIVLSMSACKKSSSNTSEVVKQFDIEKATQTVENYIKADMTDDASKMQSLYSKDFKKKAEEKKVNNIIITGYKLNEVVQSGDMGIIKARITKVNTQLPYAQLETYTFKIIKEKKDYKIKELANTNEKEVFAQDKQLRIRLDDKAKTLLVTSMEGIPRNYCTREDKAKANPIPVSLEQYGAMALTYEGTAQALSTKGKNSFIEIVHYEEAMMTQTDMGKGGGGEAQQGGGEMNVAPEKPLSKEIVGIDIIQNGTIDKMVFSQDEKLLAVQYTKNDTEKSIKIYKHKNGEQVSFDFNKQYPIDKVDLTIQSFPKDGLIYVVSAKDNFKDDTSIKDIVGKYKIDTDKFKIKKAND